MSDSENVPKKSPKPKGAKKAKPFDTDVKRFRFSDRIRLTCPKCGKTRIRDGSRDDDYLSYPMANEAFDLNCYCRECEHEWTVKAILHVRLEVLPTP